MAKKKKRKVEKPAVQPTLAPIVNMNVIDHVKAGMLIYGVTTFSRAIPSELDGFIKVDRRVMFIVHKDKVFKPTVVASLRGAVNNYHPHSDLSISDTISKMAQEGLTQNHSLLNGSVGNYGSKLNFTCAAPRYISTELTPFGRDAVISLMRNDSIEWKEGEVKFDAEEPVFLPTKLPLLLVNGTTGIAVSFVSNVPQHSLNDVADLTIKYIKNKNVRPRELVKNFYPDYCVGGVLLNGKEVNEAYATDGKCKIRIRGEVVLDQAENEIIIHSMPLSVSFESVMSMINEIKKTKKNPIISNILRTGDREVTKNGDTFMFVKCKNGTNLNEVLEELYRKTNLQMTNNVTLNLTTRSGTIKHVNIKGILEGWYKANYNNRRSNITNLKNDLANDRHDLEALLIVRPNLKAVIDMLTNDKSKDDNTTIAKLSKKFKVTLRQAKFICSMRLMALTNRANGNVEDQLKVVNDKISQLEKDILNIDQIMIDGILDLKKKYGRPRRTRVVKADNNATTSITISAGSVLTDMGHYGLFDASNIVLGKKIVNGLKSNKVDGKWVKGIASNQEVVADVTGIVVFYTDGSAVIQPINKEVMNSWIPDSFVTEKKKVLTAMPKYKDLQGTYVGITKTGMLKRFKVDNITNRISNLGEPFKAIVFVPDNNRGSNLAIMDDKGYSIITKLSGISVTGKSSIGVKTQVNVKGKVFMTVLDSAHTDLVVLMQGKKVQTNFAMTASIKSLVPVNRTNKPKQIFPFAGFRYTGISTLDLSNRDLVAIFISHETVTSLKGTALRNLKDPRKINNESIGVVGVSL